MCERQCGTVVRTWVALAPAFLGSDPYLLTLCLSFVTCKRGLMIVPSSAQHPSKVWGDYQKVVTLRL